jgi:hypothetical protein
MEDMFKRNLLRMKNPPAPATFAEALMGFVSWAKKSSTPRESRRVVAPESFTEKKQVLESLERFAQEKVADLPKPVIKLDGGEIHVKPVPEWEVPLYSSVDELAKNLTLKEYLEVLLRKKNPGMVKAFFVTETFRPWKEVGPELKGTFLDELLLGLAPKTAELFERMIGAMKLVPEEVLIYPIEAQGKDLSEEVMSMAATFKPEVMITLGALATNKILKGNDRLSLIHGQFFTRKVAGSGDFQVVPLFHPSIIESNQNMKKTAWSDMQKIMKSLKKLP